jgi:uncharacterized membrane protein
MSTTKTTIRTWLAISATVLLLDAVWLTITGSSMYAPALAAVQGEGGVGSALSVRWAGAIVAYAALIVGIGAFVVPMAAAAASRGGGVGSAMWHGGLFGFVTYAVYNGTNYATLRAWSAGVAAIDTAWGTTLCVIAAMAGSLVSAA